MNLEPIFIHSSFRTSSTWFWNEFRICDGVMGFCEIFHEALATMKPEEVERHHPGAWRSNHPAGVAPYFTEFAPLMRPEGGVEGYDAAMAFDRFIPAGGLDGDISADEAAYVERLITLAAAAGKRAAPSCTRMLGRVAGLKRRFGGSHIFLHRNLLQQWLSYCSLLENHNPYFANTIFYTLDRNRHDPFVAAVLAAVDLQGVAPGAELGQGALVCDEEAFIAFAALHLHLSAHAARVADVTVDANALARDAAYRRETEERLAAAAGLRVNLSGARESVEYADFTVRNPAGCRSRLETLAAAVLSGDDVGAAFARRMLDATMEELDRHQLHTRAVRSLLAAARKERDEWREATERVETHAAAQQDHLDAVLARVDALQGDIDKRKAHAEELIVRIDALQTHIETQTTEKSQLTAQIDQLLRHAATQKGHLEALLTRVDELQGDIDKRKAHAEELTARIDALQGDIDKRKAHAEELSARIDALQAHIEMQTAEKAQLAAQIDQLLRHADAQQAHIAVLLPRIDQLQARIDEIDLEKSDLQSRYDQLLLDHAAACAERDAMRESTSWKVTAPIRWLKEPNRREAPED